MDLNQEDWTKQLTEDNNSVILDVRTEEEVDLGFIPKAINIDIYQGQNFIDAIENLDKSKNYYVYCRSGVRSVKACNIMNEIGINNTYNLLGGFNEWDGEIDYI